MLDSGIGGFLEFFLEEEEVEEVEEDAETVDKPDEEAST
jgi:hypothetical protein